METPVALFAEPRFHNDDAAREYLESIRWPAGPVCPHCSGKERISKVAGGRAGLLWCGPCRKQFTVTVGTVFERSKVPLHKWVLATHMVCSGKKGVSSHQIHRTLGVTYKTAWFMTHRIREAMANGFNGPLGSNGEIVEVDETYWGNEGKKKPGARGGDHKMKVLSLVERNGSKRSFHIANVNAANIWPILKEQVSKKARLMTDEAAVYAKPGAEYAEHGVVNHRRKEYARGHITTNSAESSFATLKRGLIGTFHHVSEKHLQRYAVEFDFRWNNRSKLGCDDVQRTAIALAGVSGKRLTYRRTSA